MREMKNSGVAWIGEMPTEWELKNIGSLFRVRNEKVNDTDFPPLSVSKGGIVPQMENVAKSDANDNRKQVLVNDFVINSRSDRKQSCGVSDLDGSVSLINTVLYTNSDRYILPGYPNLLMKNYGFAEEFYRWGHGIVADLWTTRWQEMKNILLPLPSLDEQRTILEKISTDSKSVDVLIANQEAQIEKLKQYKQSLITEVVTKGLNPDAEMKDSGVEWIGEIPTSFSMMRLKNLGKARNGLTYSPENLCDDGTLVLRSSNVQNGKLCFEDNVYVDSDIKEELMVKKGDILICSRNGSRALIGKSAIIDCDLKASFGAFMMIFRSIHNPRYIYYILNSNIFSYYLGTYLTATINQLTGANFNGMVVPFCSDVSTQNEIVRYLDEQCSKIDKLIEIKQSKIAKLNEYKKSLIYEYVTGKKEVV